MEATPLRRSPDFRRYWTARMVSAAGTLITYVTLPILVYQLTGSSLWTALVTAAEGLPYLCFGLFAGAVADRVDRRRLMVATDLVNAAVLGSVPLAYLLDALTAPHVLVAGAVTQSLYVFFDAANFGALPSLVGRTRIAAANSTVHGSTTLLELVVPPLVGAAIALTSPAPLLAVDVVSFVASALLIRAIVTPLQVRLDGPRAPLAVDIREGLSYLWHQPVVRTQTFVGGLQAAAGGAFMGQFVPWLDHDLGIPPTGDVRLGLLFTGWAAGGLVASARFPRVVRTLGEARVTLLFLPASALCELLCALSGDWVTAAVLLACWSVAYQLVLLTAVTTRQRVTPDRLQSRVNTAARMLSFGLGAPLGALAGGMVSHAYGLRAAMVAAAGVIVMAAVAAWLSPLRRPRDVDLETVA